MAQELRQKPLLLITGFLGAGKTTLLRSLLDDLLQNDIRADVILNDFANAELDVATIDPTTVASIAPIAASCACCESMDELTELCMKAAEGDGDVLLIELNGTADPLALQEAFTLLEKSLPFFPRFQVCVVDVRHWGRRGELNALESRQLETAGMTLLSHGGGVESEQLRKVKETLALVGPHSLTVSAKQLASSLMAEVSRPRSSPVITPLDKSGRGHDRAHQLSHRVTGLQVSLPPKVRRASIERLLDQLPDWVLRAKALVKLVEEPGVRWLFERVGREVMPQPIPVPGITRLPPSLLCIGPCLDKGRIDEIVAAEFPGLECR